jgi:ketosteroid isomerase-like protein
MSLALVRGNMNDMKTNLIRILILTLALHFSSPAQAQPTEANHQADHAALRVLRGKAVTAMDNQDVQGLTACFANNFAFTTVTQEVLTNAAQVQNFFDRMFHGQHALITSLKTEPQADILTRFLNDNAGICYGTSKDTYTMKSGEVVEMNVRWSATVVKENGEWKVAQAQVGTDFLNNPVLDRLTSFWEETLLIACPAGLVAGLLIGWLLGRRGKAKPA